ncbi:MAG TPA: serine/threonine-protein kinase, partial [Polyangiaceae bacterium]|nr:serine/threonine-protein kinase [Polyangiaceae bacterium]
MESGHFTLPAIGQGYVVQEMLGEGGMGAVYAANHARFGRVVVKVMHAALGEAQKDRMRLEGEAVARVSSPHVVKVLDWGVTTDRRPFLAMERLDGQTLDEELIDRRVLPVAEAVRITIDILRGLQAVHERKLVHRDVKPSNVFLSGSEKTAKLLDFGIVKLVEAVTGVAPLAVPTKHGAAIGTPRFMAPEQIYAQGVDGRADLYAAGVMLYLMLTGEHMFAYKDVSQLMIAHATEPAKPPSHRAPQPIAPELDAIVLRALEKDPDARFGDAESFAAELGRFLGAPAVPVAPTELFAPHEAAPRPAALALPLIQPPPRMAASAGGTRAFWIAIAVG